MSVTFSGVSQCVKSIPDKTETPVAEETGDKVLHIRYSSYLTQRGKIRYMDRAQPQSVGCGFFTCESTNLYSQYITLHVLTSDV